jgi:hypothetical protein
MIRRKVRALELAAITLDETDRVSEGVYTLPSNLKEVRAIYGTVNSERVLLTNVGVSGLLAIADTDPAIYYAIHGTRIEFRGVPGTDSEFEILGLGWPDALATTSTNDLLTNFEDLYVFGTLFFLYNHTQDRELAQDSLSVFEDVVTHINRLPRRLSGNLQPPPVYNFGAMSTGTRY